MRPRSKLLSKRRLLLPTIKEGDAEETARDWKENNALHITGRSVSSEDYLLSICHLAHPTFPIRDVSPDSVCTRLRLTRLGGNTSSTYRVSRSEEDPPLQQGERKEVNSKLPSGCLGNSDPLEYLYGHQSHLSVRCASQPGVVRRAFLRPNGTIWEARTRAHSIPAASAIDLPWQRKNSCPQQDGIADADPPSFSPKCSSSRREAARGSSAEEDRQNLTIKQSLISQWISDCRSAWRDTRAQACMLPAIAEV